MILLPLLFMLPYSLTLHENCDTKLDVRVIGKSYVGPLEVCWLGGNNSYRWWPVWWFSSVLESIWSRKSMQAAYFHGSFISRYVAAILPKCILFMLIFFSHRSSRISKI